MTKDKFTYSFKVTGLERKQVASVIADTIGEQAKYAGVPSFNYNAGGWTIDKQGIITTPEIGIKEEHVTLRMVLDALNTAGATAEGNLTVTLPMDGHNGNSLRNLVNFIWSKQSLIQKSFVRNKCILPEGLVNASNAVPIESLEDFAKVINDAIEAGQIEGESELEFDLAAQTVSFSFFNASLDAKEVQAYGIFCWQLNEQAKKQKFSSMKQRVSTNDRYTMRCYLLKLGFIGVDFKASRDIILFNLEGDAAYRTTEAKQAAEAKRKGVPV